jgi:hypothetical protein
VIVSGIEQGLFVLCPHEDRAECGEQSQPGDTQQGGGGQVGAAGGPAQQTRAFRLRANFGRQAYRVRGRSFRVRCRANGTGPRPCRITATWRGRRIGSGQALIVRRSRVVSVRLNGLGRRLMRRRGSIVARLALRVRDQAGRSAGRAKIARVRLVR